MKFTQSTRHNRIYRAGPEAGSTRYAVCSPASGLIFRFRALGHGRQDFPGPVPVFRGHQQAHPPDELQHGVGAAGVVGHHQGLDALGLQQPRGHLRNHAVGKGFQDYGVVEVHGSLFNKRSLLEVNKLSKSDYILKTFLPNNRKRSSLVQGWLLITAQSRIE